MYALVLVWMFGCFFKQTFLYLVRHNALYRIICFVTWICVQGRRK